MSVILTSPCLVSRRKPREFCEDFTAGQGQQWESPGHQLAGQPEVSAFETEPLALGDPSVLPRSL